MCLHRRGAPTVPFAWGGASTSMEDGVRALVVRSLMVYASPPMAFAEPGRMRAVVMPAAIESG
jgi:hypothetical protein